MERQLYEAKCTSWVLSATLERISLSSVEARSLREAQTG